MTRWWWMRRVVHGNTWFAFRRIDSVITVMWKWWSLSAREDLKHHPSPSDRLSISKISFCCPGLVFMGTLHPTEGDDAVWGRDLSSECIHKIDTVSLSDFREVRERTHRNQKGKHWSKIASLGKMLERLKCDALGSADASRKLMRFDNSNDSLLDHSYLASKELWTDNDASRVYWTASNNKKAIFFLARLENLIITWKLMMKRVALDGWMDVNKSLLFLVPSTFRRTEDYDSYRRSFMRWWRAMAWSKSWRLRSLTF